jgi:TetR/AcrR family transcriptional regulator, cholesterol catabolism regulator
MVPRPRGARTAVAIRRAAVELFYKHGYDTTSLRDIAEVVGVNLGSLYHHIPSMEQLLFSIMSEVMHDLLGSLERALEPYTEAVDRMRAAVECHVTFHADRAKEIFVGNSEPRSLTKPDRRTVVGLRDRYEANFLRTLEQGADAGVFHYTDAKLLTYAILATGTQVSAWYKTRGRLSLRQIASTYSDFVLRGLTNDRPQVPFGEVLEVQAS